MESLESLMKTLSSLMEHLKEYLSADYTLVYSLFFLISQLSLTNYIQGKLAKYSLEHKY